MCSVFITYILDTVSLYTESAGPALHGGLGDELHMNELDDRIMNARGRLTHRYLVCMKPHPSLCVCLCVFLTD